MSLDLAARQVVVASVCYYGLDLNVMDDAEYDALAARLAAEWDSLDPIRKWMLGSAREIAASGFHVNATGAAISSVASLVPFRINRNRKWRHSKVHRVDYLKPNEIERA